MPHHGPTPPNSLDALLQSASRRLTRHAALTSSLWVGSLGVCLLTLAVFADATGVIEGRLRWVLSGLLIAWVLAGPVCVAYALRRAKWDRRRLARKIEVLADVRDSALINPVTLEDDRSPALANDIRLAADRCAAGIDVDQIALTRKPLGAWSSAGVCTTVALLTVAFWPGIWRASIPRILQPMADLAPYTPLHFEVTVEHDPANPNAPARVRATITGDVLPDSADIVWNNPGQAQRVEMMRRTDGGRFELALGTALLGQPFHIQTPGGRSATLRVNMPNNNASARSTGTSDSPSPSSDNPARSQASEGSGTGSGSGEGDVDNPRLARGAGEPEFASADHGEPLATGSTLDPSRAAPDDKALVVWAQAAPLRYRDLTLAYRLAMQRDQNPKPTEAQP